MLLSTLNKILEAFGREGGEKERERERAIPTDDDPFPDHVDPVSDERKKSRLSPEKAISSANDISGRNLRGKRPIDCMQSQCCYSACSQSHKAAILHTVTGLPSCMQLESQSCHLHAIKELRSCHFACSQSHRVAIDCDQSG